MKAVVMAGGSGSRLRPYLANPLNKHLASVGSKPMIAWPLETLAEGGVTDVIVLLNWRHPGLMIETIANLNLPLNICYAYDPTDVIAGPGRHLLLAEPWLQGEQDFVLMLGDSVFMHRLDFAKPQAPHIWTMALQGDDDPSKYGQVKTSGAHVTDIREKPEQQFSSIIQTGVWKLPTDVFERIRTVGRVTDGELHVGDVTSTYIEDGSMTHTGLPPHSYLDCGTPEAIKRAEALLQQITTEENLAAT